MKLSSTQLSLLQHLSDGQCHSGTELGLHLQIGRSAIWKQINQLIHLGIPIIRIAQQGYQLPHPLRLLNEQEIAEQLHLYGFTDPYTLHLFHSLDSTNRYLKDLPPHPLTDICCTEIQTKGRGRFGRYWYSPFGENIYCSSRWTLHCDFSELFGLSLVTSLAVLRTITDLFTLNGLTKEMIHPLIQIKWPNDILWGNKKLCGNLIEIVGESNSITQIIIGIGLNVNAHQEEHLALEKPWSSLYEISKQYYNRNTLIALLIVNLQRYISQFVEQGLSSFMDEWRAVDYLLNKTIEVSQSLNNKMIGVAKGINSLGQLILENEHGVQHYLSSGDTSIQGYQ